MSFRKTSHARTWRTSGTWEWHRFNELFFCLPDVFYRRSQRPSCLFGAVYFGHLFMTRRGRPLGGSQVVIATLHRSVHQTSCGRHRKRSSAQTWIRPSCARLIIYYWGVYNINISQRGSLRFRKDIATLSLPISLNYSCAETLRLK